MPELFADGIGWRAEHTISRETDVLLELMARTAPAWPGTAVRCGGLGQLAWHGDAVLDNVQSSTFLATDRCNVLAAYDYVVLPHGGHDLDPRRLCSVMGRQIPIGHMKQRV